MYSIGQVSEMFNLPISTIRYYDKEGLFPALSVGLETEYSVSAKLKRSE